jgi:predicted N-formylglutamate amidohydrolase
MNPACSEEAWTGLGDPCANGILILGDHASAYVPNDIDLQIAPELLNLHIACDIGVTAVAQQLIAQKSADTAILGGVSRLVIDCNRDVGDAGLIPLHSDGHSIAGNILTEVQRAERISRFYDPYHAKIAQVCRAARPLFIVSLHSFTPLLATANANRPWEIGVLYNADERLARLAIPMLDAAGLVTGDQQPYSGKDLNHTMNIHAEANNIPYLGLEMRQDCVSDNSGQARFADIIANILSRCRNYLAN